MVTYDPSSGTANISQFGNPSQIASLYPTTPGTVMQGLYIDARGLLYVTQQTQGWLAITQYEGPSVSTTHNDPLGQMIITDGGHGIGLHAECPSGATYIWASLPDRLARFKWTPGFKGTASQLTDLSWKGDFDNYLGQKQESVYNFDTRSGWAVERQWDFANNNRERYTRRKISDVSAGIDQPYGQIWLPATPPTMQGFTTINNTFFRWLGKHNADSLGQMNPTDPMAVEQYDWNTGQRIGYKTFPTLSSPWKDGQYEPEGAAAYPESDGTISLLVGMTTGSAANGHRWPIFKFNKIGQ